MEAQIKLPDSLVEKHIEERRWGTRRPSPTLAVYYWNGGTPKPHGVRDISASGVYLITDEPLFPGTMLLLTMQREDLDESNPDRWIAVHALVIRRDRNGVALSFVFPRTRDSRVWESDVANGATRDELARFMSKLFAYNDHQIRSKASVSGVHLATPDLKIISAGAECSATRKKAGTTNICVCNLTRKNLISLDMSIVNAVHEPLKTVVDDLAHVPSSGFWLTPFRGFPLGGELSRFDVVFLDDNYKVAECVEQFAVAESGAFQGEHPSALVVPARTISSSQIQVGDQLRICSPESRATDLTDPLWSVANKTKRAARLKGKASACLRNETSALLQDTAVRAGRTPEAKDEKHRTIPLDLSTVSLKTRFLRWLFPEVKPRDRRRADRVSVPDLVAFHCTGGEPRAQKVGDVSSSGFYLLTDERWLPGTRIVMTLQKENSAKHVVPDWSRVESKVVRWGVDGVGFEFVDMNHAEILQGGELEKGSLDRFLAGVMVTPQNGPHAVQ